MALIRAQIKDAVREVGAVVQFAVTLSVWAETENKQRDALFIFFSGR